MGLFSLNNQQVAKKVSQVVYKNLAQDLLHKDGFGLTDRFIKPTDMNASMIDIYVPVPLAGRFRMRGDGPNGKWTNTKNLVDATTGQRRHVLSKRFTIDLLKCYDENIAISEDEIEMTGGANLDESFETICRRQIEQDIAVNINGYTFATQIYQYFVDSFSATPTATQIANHAILFTYSQADLTGALRSFKLANALVSKGDRTIYAGYFPADERQAFIWNSTFLVYMSLPATSHASDIATKMVAGGGLNPFTNEKRTVADFEAGYVGWSDGMPLYQAQQQVLDATWYYMGLDATVTADAAVIALLEMIACFICPANATIRGLKPTSFKTVDDPDTQGVIVQPKVRMGVRCVSGRALKFIFTDDGSASFNTVANAITSIAAIRAGILNKLVLPNMSFDNDNKVQTASTLAATAQGVQTLS